MNIIRLTFANLKRYVKTPSILLSLVLVPIVVIGLCMFLTRDISTSSEGQLENIALVCNLENNTDKSADFEYQEALIKELNISNENIYALNEKDQALEQLKNNKLAAVFVVDDDFSEMIKDGKKPTVDVIKTSKGGGSLFSESEIQTFINTSLKKQIDPNFSSKYIKTTVTKKEESSFKENVMSVFLICYILYINGVTICKDLIDLKKSNTLKRMLSTKNKDFEILFSLFLSLFLIQALVYTVVLVICNILLDVGINAWDISLILTNSLLCTGIILFLARICKNEATISFVMVGYVFLSLATSLPTMIPNLGIDMPFVVNISKFMPMYWTIDAIINDNYFKNIIVLILLSLVFVTAGSLKLKEFAKN